MFMSILKTSEVYIGLQVSTAAKENDGVCLRVQTGFCKARCTRYDFFAYEKLTTGLRHELFLVNQTFNSLTIFL